MKTFNNYAQNLPTELKIQILIHLPYKDVMFITDQYFWLKYWENYNQKNPLNFGIFKPNP